MFQRMIKDYTKLSDQLLLEECRLNNTRAYDQLFERYSGVLYNFSLSYVKDATVAEELVMDLMFNIWQKRHRLEINGELGAYLFRAMKNVMFNFIRKRQLSTVNLETLSVELPAENNRADADMEYKDLQRIYQLKINQLSPQRRKIFQLSREEEMTYLQIAEKMSLSVNTIKTQMWITLKYLRENMKEYIDITMLLLFILIF